ncbi:AarF/UbiB family protein [Endozoicomonas sp.]|uniref:AarF/UbiB family protein n=1 Tax=Endozoicomonas sp. TaxID=1892382 RepID=UPI0028871A21|nr:AarF/UbiB family protein [Endozoicomonas sp.]
MKIIQNLIIPVIERIALFGIDNLNGISAFFDIISEETDLSRELEYTQTQAEIFKSLSSNGDYHIVLPVNAEAEDSVEVVEKLLVSVEISCGNTVSDSSDGKYSLKRKSVESSDTSFTNKDNGTPSPAKSVRFEDGSTSASNLNDKGRKVQVKFKVPDVYPDFSSSDVLVMELIDGCTLDRVQEIKDMLGRWTPAWNNQQPLSEAQIQLTCSQLKEQILKVYRDAGRIHCFFNGDFQTGNMMMTLDDDDICIYFIDHGNCFTVKSIFTHAIGMLNYQLIKSLFKLFHHRFHDSVEDSDSNSFQAKKVEAEVPVVSHEQDDGAEPIWIKDLTFVPLTNDGLKCLERDITYLFGDSIGDDIRLSEADYI